MDKQVDDARAVVDDNLGAVEVGEVAAFAHINADPFGLVSVAQRKHQPVLLDGLDCLWKKKKKVMREKWTMHENRSKPMSCCR